MIYTSDELLKIIHETEALSIWNRKKGPVFWYIANVPGPFYLNTELMLGAELSKRLLESIDGILASTPASDPAGRARELHKLMMTAYEKNPIYKGIIATMIARATQKIPESSYSFISGGERRDWLFSLPFAKEVGKKHVFLFKDKSTYCELGFKPPETGLHIADLINNAASYFDAWFPALEKAKLKCVGTVCVNSRGEGVKKLEAAGQKVVALSHIDLSFFKQSVAKGLTEQATCDEIASYFASPTEWAKHYLMNRIEVFDVARIDKKSFARLQNFFANDPWQLRKDYTDFYASMEEKITERLKQAA